MTPDEAIRRVAEVSGYGGDPEHAHIAEDDLRADVLHAISTDESLSLEDVRFLAGVALTTSSFDFPRWYA